MVVFVYSIVFYCRCIQQENTTHGTLAIPWEYNTNTNTLQKTKTKTKNEKGKNENTKRQNRRTREVKKIQGGV